jgi:hypothetical protein
MTYGPGHEDFDPFIYGDPSCSRRSPRARLHRARYHAPAMRHVVPSCGMLSRHAACCPSHPALMG